MRKFGILMPVLMVLLAACGGGTTFSTPGTASSSSSGGSQVASITVTTSAAQISTDGTQTAIITAIAKTAGNAVVPGVTVTFSATSGTVAPSQTVAGAAATPVVPAGTTDANGTAQATLSTVGQATPRTITVTATIGASSATVQVAVVNSQTSSLTLTTNLTQIKSSNSLPAILTALVRDANNNVVPGIKVTFSATSGAISPVQTVAGAAAAPQVAAGTTDANGQAQATLSTGGDPSSRPITVTATESTISQQVVVQVSGSSLTLSGPTSLVLQNSGTYTITLADSAGNPISGQTVNLTSALGNSLPATVTTAAPTGSATFTMSATIAGKDTITASSAVAGATTLGVNVSNQAFAFTTPVPPTSPANVQNVPLNTAQTVTVNWTASGAPVPQGTPVTISTTRGTFPNGTGVTQAFTDANGNASTTITSTTAGAAALTATGTLNTVSVSATSQLEFIATVPAKIDAQVSAVTVQPGGSVTITAVVWDAQQNLVADQVVDFILTDKTGGAISVGAALTSDAGVAQTVYTATQTASASGGVSVQAVVASNTALTSTVNFTVAGKALFLSLGTGIHISENTPQTQFIMPWVVQVIDSSGNPVANTQVVLTVHSFPFSQIPSADVFTQFGNTLDPYAAYRKGGYVPSGSTACGNSPVVGTQWCLAVASDNTGGPAECYNEDTNGSGIYSASEDVNGNGKLDPGDIATVSGGNGTTTSGTVTTDSTGTATFNVYYPEDYAEWVQVYLQASASVPSGTQYFAGSSFWLPVLSSYVSTQGVTPPGSVSPFGVNGLCTKPN